MRMSDWSSDVCSSDLVARFGWLWPEIAHGPVRIDAFGQQLPEDIELQEAVVHGKPAGALLPLGRGLFQQLEGGQRSCCPSRDRLQQQRHQTKGQIRGAGLLTDLFQERADDLLVPM